ncbi:hypothetical protein JOL62DRAFT_64519 [Phyllosticta paracitricarpa]|uniref:Secreted protein n=1 Tax=Phyllosticta paracitricarpa TaxID=2016321 RepID=A0ABR1N8U5_9PEZI
MHCFLRVGVGVGVVARCLPTYLPTCFLCGNVARPLSARVTQLTRTAQRFFIHRSSDEEHIAVLGCLCTCTYYLPADSPSAQYLASPRLAHLLTYRPNSPLPPFPLPAPASFLSFPFPLARSPANAKHGSRKVNARKRAPAATRGLLLRRCSCVPRRARRLKKSAEQNRGVVWLL